MRIVFFIIVLLHALIHMLGFVKSFGLKEVKELTLPISKPMGLLWLTAALLLLTYSIMYLTHSRYTWLIGFIGVAVSQVLIVLFWKDARFGTLPNIAILLVSVISFGHYRFQKLVQQETSQIISRGEIPEERIVSEDDIQELPRPVQKWLRHSGMVGKPFIYIGQVVQRAEMKLKPEQEKWYQATANQYTTVDVPAFIWTAEVKMNSVMNFQGRDKFENRKGHMLIKLNSVIKVVDEQGEKLNEGTLQRYLGEMVWFPSMALSPYISWEEVNDTTAIARMNYKGTTGSGIFYFNQEGDFTTFSAMRYKGNEAGAKRYEWVLLVDEHQTFEGIRVPSEMTATWKLENEDWTWLKLKIEDIRYNENVIPMK